MTTATPRAHAPVLSAGRAAAVAVVVSGVLVVGGPGLLGWDGY
jgi:hypothetical protein